MEYPEIGKEINYMRSTQDGEVLQGRGITKAIFLDPRNRLMVGVVDVDTGDNWNIDLYGVNPSAEAVDSYGATLGKVREISAAGNDVVKDVVKEYNNKVEALYDELLGAPIDFVEPEKAKKD